MDNNTTCSTFGEYVRQHRFRGIDAPDRIEKELTLCRSKAPYLSGVVLVHAPYPEDSEANESELPASEEMPEVSSGQGCGKSDLLILTEERLGKRKDCRVITFLNNQDKVVNGVGFYQDVFLERLARLDRRLIYPTWSRLAETGEFASSLLQRVSLLIYVAVPVFVAVIAYVLSLLGFKALEFFVDPKNQPFLTGAIAWFQHNQWWLTTIAALGFVFWVFYAWGALQRDERLWQRWQALGHLHSRAERVSETKEMLANDPERVLRRFADRGRTLVLLIDDIDVMDGFSFQALMRLYDQAKQSQRWSLLLVLTYNPCNPGLYQPAKSIIRQELDPVRVSEQRWTSIQLESPKPEDLRAWLWGYYGHPQAAELLGILEQTYLEARTNPSLVLSFFTALDRQLSAKDLLIKVDGESIKREFERYLNRDRRMAQDVIRTIAQNELAEGCLEMLKYILAFKRLQVPVKHVEAIMAHTSHKDVNAYERILLSEQVNLLRKTYVHDELNYVFRQPYLRSVLDTGWKQWRENAQTYYTEVFLGLHRLPKIKENPEVALEAAPSKLAIDVLYREGEYFYRYYASSDAGHALRFYGLEQGGALGKWLKLCEDTIENQEDLWDLIYWKSEARINPLRHLSSSKTYPVWSFAPDLVLTAGCLYWMIGQWEKAEYIWTQRWPSVLSKLPPAPDAELAQRVRKADAEIQAALAEMLYEVGQPGNWNRANDLCLSLRQQASPEFQTPYKANLILALVRHYRAIGVGNALPPYQFLRPDVKLDFLKATFDTIPTTEVDRLRLLHATADSLWQVLVVPPGPLPLDIDLDTIRPLKVDSATFEQFAQVLEKEQQTLESILEYRKSQKRDILSVDRVKEGDLLFWESMFLLMRARHFCLNALKEFGRYSQVLREGRHSRARQRLSAYRTVADMLERFYTTRLLDCKPSPQFTAQMHQLEEIYRTPSTGQADTVQQAEREARRVTEQLYRLGWEGIIAKARERLREAETVYRHLGCQQGIAATTFARALMVHEFSAPAPFAEHPGWVDDFERFYKCSSNRLGYHLDTLRAHIIVGQWASERDLYRAIQEFQSADTWAPHDCLGLPKAISGEISFQIGDLIGLMESAPFPHDYAFKVFDKAAQGLDDLGDNLPYIDQSEITNRRLTIHWWLAELSQRQAQSAVDPVAREKHLDRVISECNYVINRSRGRDEHARMENLARLVRGQSLADRGEMCKAFEEVEQSLKYFEAEGDSFNALQALIRLVQWGAYQKSKERKWHRCVERSQNQHFPALSGRAGQYLSQVATLKFRDRLVLHHAGHLLGRIFAQRLGNYDQALYWLNAAFDVLVSLSLYGNAILLDDDIRPVYEALGDNAGLETHKKRILQAAQRLDPMREKIPFSLISPILRRYAQVVFAESQDITTKRECLDWAKRALWREEPEIGPALEFLERAHNLIDLHNPEEIDVDILKQLIVAYYRQGNPEKAGKAEEILSLVQSTIQSRDFLALSEHYKATGGDYLWALRIAADATPPNEYSRKAQDMVRREPIQIEEQEKPDRQARL